MPSTRRATRCLAVRKAAFNRYIEDPYDGAAPMRDRRARWRG